MEKIYLLKNIFLTNLKKVGIALIFLGSFFSAQSQTSSETFINFCNNNQFAPAPWNNTGYAIQKGKVFSLKDQLGIGSGKMKWITGWSSTPDLGVDTRNNSGIYPDKVIVSDFLYSGKGKAIIEFSNLDTNKAYDFTIFASWDHPWYPAHMYYKIGKQAVFLDAKNNTKNTATLKGLRPDPNGTLYLYAGNSAGHLYPALIGSITYTSYTPSNSIPTPQALSAILVADPNSVLAVNLSWDLVPGFSKYYIYRSDNGGSSFIKLDSVSDSLGTMGKVGYSDRKLENNILIYKIAVVNSSYRTSNFSNTDSITVIYPPILYGPMNPCLQKPYLDWQNSNTRIGDTALLYRSTIGVQGPFFLIAKTSNHPYLEVPLNPDSVYYYYAVFTGNGQLSLPSNLVSIGPNAQYALGLAGTASTANKITLDLIGKTPQFDCLTIYSAKSKNTPFYQIVPQGINPSHNYVCGTTHFVDSNLQANSTYYYYGVVTFSCGNLSPQVLDTIQVTTPAYSDSINKIDFTAYPDPFSNVINFSFYSPNSGQYYIVLNSIYGGTVYSNGLFPIVPGLNSGQINSGIQGLKSGLYYFTLGIGISTPSGFTETKETTLLIQKL